MFGKFTTATTISLFFIVSADVNKIGKLDYGKIKHTGINDVTQTQDHLYELHSNSSLFNKFISQMNSDEFENFLRYSQDYADSRERTQELWLKHTMKNKPQLVGFGGPSHASEKRMLFRNITSYANKVINHAQLQLEQNAQRIWANNPPQVIDKIPYTPIVFILKYIEGASTLGTNGTTWAIHYFDEVYVSTRYRFDEIRYYYNVQIKPFNLFAIRTSITVILDDAPATMSFSSEKNKFNIPRFEFTEPDVSIDLGIHRWINYVVNYVLNEKYPKLKRKLVKIASRDTLLLLNDELKNAQ